MPSLKQLLSHYVIRTDWGMDKNTEVVSFIQSIYTNIMHGCCLSPHVDWFWDCMSPSCVSINTTVVIYAPLEAADESADMLCFLFSW